VLSLILTKRVHSALYSYCVSVRKCSHNFTNRASRLFRSSYIARFEAGFDFVRGFALAVDCGQLARRFSVFRFPFTQSSIAESGNFRWEAEASWRQGRSRGRRTRAGSRLSTCGRVAASTDADRRGTTEKRGERRQKKFPFRLITTVSRTRPPESERPIAPRIDFPKLEHGDIAKGNNVHIPCWCLMSSPHAVRPSQYVMQWNFIEEATAFMRVVSDGCAQHSRFRHAQPHRKVDPLKSLFILKPRALFARKLVN
jgi:hypothetical protein